MGNLANWKKDGVSIIEHLWLVALHIAVNSNGRFPKLGFWGHREHSRSRRLSRAWLL